MRNILKFTLLVFLKRRKRRQRIKPLFGEEIEKLARSPTYGVGRGVIKTNKRKYVCSLIYFFVFFLLKLKDFFSSLFPLEYLKK